MSETSVQVQQEEPVVVTFARAMEEFFGYPPSKVEQEKVYNAPEDHPVWKRMKAQYQGPVV